MPVINKYSSSRQFISLSLNKYNLYNLNGLKKKFFSRKKFHKKMTLYKRQLIAKQRLRKYYGNIREGQFFSLYKKASLYKGSPSSNLFILLERRLDVIVFRSGFAPSIFASRQLISHGHILVNNDMITISNFMINPGDIISVNIKSLNIVKKILSQKFKCSYKMKNLLKKNYLTPGYLEVNYNILTSMLIKNPSKEKIPHPIKFSKILIDKYYSRA